MATYDVQSSFIKYVVKKAKSILVPFYGCALLSLALFVIKSNGDINGLKYHLEMLKMGGIRNTFVAGSLWFLSCLFFMEIIFKLIKFIKNKVAIFIICMVLYTIAVSVILPPRWIYNIDSALKYIIYYALGYILYPYLLKLFELNAIYKKMMFFILGGLSGCYAGFLFLGKDLIQPLIGDVWNIPIFAPIVSAMLLIFFNLFLARLIDGVIIFNEIGRETLYLCGNEYIFKNILVCVLEVFGLSTQFSTPLTAWIYTMILLYVGVKLLIPFEKRIIKSVKDSRKYELRNP